MAMPDPMPLRVRRYEAGSAPYQALLRQYLPGRLGLGPAEDERLGDAIIRAADEHFADVSFLADRIYVALPARDRLGDFATHGRHPREFRSLRYARSSSGWCASYLRRDWSRSPPGKTTGSFQGSWHRPRTIGSKARPSESGAVSSRPSLGGVARSA
jgi:hypothetical protein